MNTVLYLQAPNETSLARLKFAGALERILAANGNLRKIAAERFRPREIRELIAFWDASGLIVDCRGRKPPFSESAFPDIPVVFLDLVRGAEASHRLTVTYDIRATCQLAARELLSLDYASYGYAGYGPGVLWSEERRRVFARGLALNGRPLSVFARDPSAVTPSAFYQRLSAWLGSLPKPCGVFAADDAYALHVHSAAQNLALRIPGDVAILGVDDESPELVSPGISSIQLDFQNAGRQAADLLLEAQGGSAVTSPHRHFGPVQLLRRNSTRPLRRLHGNLPEVLERIREQAARGLTATEVASWLPGSRRLAEIRFREATGHSILEEIAAVRIDRAKKLLASTNDPIGEIAERCGYRTFNAFRDAFKSATGLTPRAWRRQ